MAKSMSQKKQDFLCSCYTPLAIRYQLLLPAISYQLFSPAIGHTLFSPTRYVSRVKGPPPKVGYRSQCLPRYNPMSRRL